MNSKTELPIEDEVWLRRLTFSEEERLSLTSAPWNGERRWFRSPNIVPLEKYREPDETARIIAVLRARKVVQLRNWANRPRDDDAA